MMIDFTRMINSTMHWLGLDQEADPPPPGPRRQESENHLSERARTAAALDSGMTVRSSRLFGESPSHGRGARSNSNQDGPRNWLLSAPMIAAAAIFGMIPVAMAIGGSNGNGEDGSDSNRRSEGPGGSERQEAPAPDAEGRATSSEIDPPFRDLLGGLREAIRDGSFSRTVEAHTNGSSHPSESLMQSYLGGEPIPSDVRVHIVLCRTCAFEFTLQRIRRNSQSTIDVPQSSVEPIQLDRFRPWNSVVEFTTDFRGRRYFGVQVSPTAQEFDRINSLLPPEGTYLANELNLAVLEPVDLETLVNREMDGMRDERLDRGERLPSHQAILSRVEGTVASNDLTWQHPRITGAGSMAVENHTVYFLTVEWPMAQGLRAQHGLEGRHLYIPIASTAIDQAGNPLLDLPNDSRIEPNLAVFSQRPSRTTSYVSMVERFRDVLGPELSDQAEELRQVVEEHWNELSRAERTEYERVSRERNPWASRGESIIPEIVILSHIEALRDRASGETIADVHARAVERLRDPQSRNILERSLREAREVARTGRR